MRKLKRRFCMCRLAKALMCMIFALSIGGGVGCDPSGPASGRDPVEDGEPEEIVIIGRGDDVVEVTGSYTAEEIQAILDNFRWDETAPWEETFSHGQPLLYYVELLAPSKASTDELTELGVPWDYLPLFDEEMPAMEGDIDVVMMEGIEAGRLVFAIITGESYNIIIAFAEECELGIDDISVEMLTLETGDAGGEGDVTAVSVSDGRTFSVVGEMTSGLCHHTELIDDGDFGFLGYAQCSGDAPLIFAFHWRAGERALTVNHAMCPTAEYF